MIRLPRSAVSRRQLTYALLIRRVYPRRQFAAFEGRLSKCGVNLEVADLWPDPDFPAVPLVLEYAGNDRTGRGHRRSNDIYILWRYDAARNAFEEVVRCVSQGAEWLDNIRPIALRELSISEVRDAQIAQKVSGRVLALLDAEIEPLADDDRATVLTFVFEQLAARAA